MLVNVKDAILNGYVVQSSASALTPHLLEEPFPSFSQKGGDRKAEMESHQCLGSSFVHTVSGGARGCTPGSTPAAAKSSHGSVVALPTLRCPPLCSLHRTLWRW